MENILTIDSKYINENTVYLELISKIKQDFKMNKTLVPLRHHHDFPNPAVNANTTLLLMPAWNPGKEAGVKIVTVNPKNERFDLPSVQGVYIYMDALTGTLKAILEAKSLTVKRTAATSALASSFLSKKDASTLLMIGTGALSTNLIKAHAGVRPIKEVFVWGRNFDKAQLICEKLKNEAFTIKAIKTIEEKISDVDIVSCATLSKTPLVHGENIKPGQHIDLVGAYKDDMREADDALIQKSFIYIDSYEGGLRESGDIAIPLAKGLINKNDIKADLFELCQLKKNGRKNDREITVFKSVGHALEDLAAATYFYTKYHTSINQ